MATKLIRTLSTIADLGAIISCNTSTSHNIVTKSRLTITFKKTKTTVDTHITMIGIDTTCGKFVVSTTENYMFYADALLPVILTDAPTYLTASSDEDDEYDDCTDVAWTVCVD